MGDQPPLDMTITDQYRAPNDWLIRHSRGSAHAFHQLPIPADLDQPQVWVHRVTNTTLVLGSTQSRSILRSTKIPKSIDVAHRRSGGGLVMISPDSDCWIDFLIPSHHHLWNRDIGRSFLWTGALWQRALHDLIPIETTIAEQPTRLWRKPLICFADSSTGELTVDHDGQPAKIIGLSQRRNRWAGRIQSLFMAHWQPEWTSVLTEAIDYEEVAKANLDGPLSSPSGPDLHAGLPTAVKSPSTDELVEAILHQCEQIDCWPRPDLADP